MSFIRARLTSATRTCNCTCIAAFVGDGLEACGLDHALHLSSGYGVSHAAGDDHRAIRLAQAYVGFGEEHTNLRVNQREVCANEDIEDEKLAARLLPRDEVDLTERLAVDEHLVRRDEHRLGYLRIRDGEATDGLIEVDDARLSDEHVDGEALFVVLERRAIGSLLRVRAQSNA
jgi:hypothetical protein